MIKTDKKDIIEITAAGDFMPGGLFSQEIEMYKDVFLDKETAAIVSSGDIRFCNLECPLLKVSGSVFLQKNLLYADERAVGPIKKAGFNLVSLANNHAMDFGWKALLNTTVLLEQENIKYVGAGANLKEAKMPVLFEARGMSLAFLAYTWTYPMFAKDSHAAGENNPGVSPYQLGHILEDVARVKKSVDFVVAAIHWGNEGTHFPDPKTVLEARKIIEAGADLILGSHPHILQGSERYNQGLIVYSLSNFLFSPPAKEKARRRKKERERRASAHSLKSMVLKCYLSKGNGVFDYEFIPIVQDSEEPKVLIPEAEESFQILNNIAKWSLVLGEKDYEAAYIREKMKENGFRSD